MELKSITIHNNATKGNFSLKANEDPKGDLNSGISYTVYDGEFKFTFSDYLAYMKIFIFVELTIIQNLRYVRQLI